MRLGQAGASAALLNHRSPANYIAVRFGTRSAMTADSPGCALMMTSHSAHEGRYNLWGVRDGFVQNPRKIMRTNPKSCLNGGAEGDRTCLLQPLENKGNFSDACYCWYTLM